MKRYAWAYAAWLAAVLSAAAVALWWYKRVEAIGWEELRDRFSSNGQPSDDALEDASPVSFVDE